MKKVATLKLKDTADHNLRVSLDSKILLCTFEVYKSEDLQERIR
jgi:hypothetical protein